MPGMANLTGKRAAWEMCITRGTCASVTRSRSRSCLPLYAVEDDGDVRFLTMELVEGRGLGELIAAGGLPAPQVPELGIALAHALIAAHERGACTATSSPRRSC